MNETQNADPFDSYMAARLDRPVAQVTAALNADEQDDFTEADGHEIAAQIGVWNLRAISGGRINVRRTGITLPCGNGYSVTIDLAGNDTYTVRRVFSRAGQAWVKGEMAGVYCDQVGEVAYRAGMFRDEWAAGSAS